MAKPWQGIRLLPSISVRFALLATLLGLALGLSVFGDPVIAYGAEPATSSGEASGSIEILSNVLSPTPVADHELSTLELTSVAVGMLLKRAKVLESSLLSEAGNSKIERLDPNAERATLEGLVQQYSSAEGGSLSAEAITNRLEAARLDLKLLRSRRDILAYRVSNLEAQSVQQQERLGQVEAELSEGRRLEEEWRTRRAALASQTVKNPAPAEAVGSATMDPSSVGVLARAKLGIVNKLLTMRGEQLTVLERIRKLLRDRIKTLRDEQDTARGIMKIADQSLHTSGDSFDRLEAQADRINLQTREKKAREAIDKARQEQTALTVKLDELDRTLLEARTASGTTSRRAILAAQRDALLATREAAGENVRLQEFDLRRAQELGRLADVQRHLASGAALIATERSIGDQFKALGEELDREKSISRKKRELLATNRTLIYQSVKEAEEKRFADDPEVRDELKYKQRQLSAIEETASIIASQEAVLVDLATRVQAVRSKLDRAIEAERERELFSRRILRFENGFPQSLLSNAALLPQAALSRGMEGIVVLSGPAWASLSIVLLATVFLVLTLRRIPAGPVLDADVAHPLGERVKHALTLFLRAEAITLGCFLIFGSLTLAVPLAHPLFVLPYGWSCGRLLAVFFRRFSEATLLPELFAKAVLDILRSCAWLLPPIALLREIDLHPECSWTLELGLKLALIHALLRLLQQEAACRGFLQATLRIRPDSNSLPFFGKMYRVAGGILIAAAAISLFGYENLGLWLISRSLFIFCLLSLATLARPISDLGADLAFAPEAPGKRFLPISDQRAQLLYFVARKGFRLGIWLTVSLLLLHRFGVTSETPVVQAMLSWFGANGEWIYSRIIRIVVILAGVAIVLEFTNTLGESIITFVRNEDRSTQSENERRASTLIQIVYTTVRVGTFCTAGIMILREIGMDITPLLTGAGIVGVAVGFGSQSLVKDFFSGFFILVENQFRVGDVIEIGGKAGLVEKINLKTTVLRGVDGSVYIIPNGEITSVKNMTYAWSRAVLDIGVAYDTDIDKAISLLQSIGDELMNAPLLKEQILERPEVLGVERLEDSAVVLRMLVKTRPLQQWIISRAFRKRILEVFAREGVEIPFPQRVVSLKVDESVQQALEALANHERQR